MSEDVTLVTVSSDVVPVLVTLTLLERMMGLPFSSQEIVGEGSPDAEHDREAVPPSRTIVFMGSVEIVGGAGNTVEK